MTHVYLWWAVEIYGSCPVYSYIPSITESHRKPEVSNPGRCGRLLGQDHGPFWQRTAQQKHAVFPWKCWWNPQLFMQISMISWDDWGKNQRILGVYPTGFFRSFWSPNLAGFPVTVSNGQIFIWWFQPSKKRWTSMGHQNHRQRWMDFFDIWNHSLGHQSNSILIMICGWWLLCLTS